VSTSTIQSPHVGQPPTPAQLQKTKPVVTSILSRVTSTITADPGPPPDGGLRAWSQCFFAWLAMMNTWGFVNSFGAFQTYYTGILPQSPSTISWIGSTQAFLMFLIGILSGRALDAGLFKITVTIGFFFQLLGVFMMSLCSKYYQLFLTQGVLTGIGGGIIFCPVMGLISTYFAKRRGVAVGLATTGNAIGGIVYPLVVRQLIPKVGFGWTVRVLGLINLVTLGCVIVFMKPRLPPRKAGPIVECSAVKDLPFVFFVVGSCCLMCSIYFVYYYVSWPLIPNSYYLVHHLYIDRLHLLPTKHLASVTWTQ
jgi:MFS family permease